MADKENSELERFLREVDEITNLVEEFKSDDPAIREKAFQKADEKLERGSSGADIVEGCKTKLNCTLINPNPSCSGPPQPPNLPGQYRMDSNVMNQDDFLTVLARDAETRGKRRKKNQKLANALKEKGNAAFKKGDYATAVQYYTDGLEKLRDFQVLYTNRAQAYIKLGKYEEAISDCEWALKCNENCIKAYVHMGKANLSLKKYEEAQQCYQKILEIDPNQEKLVKEYMNLLELAQKKEQQEKEVVEEFERGNVNTTTAHEVLKKLSSSNKIPYFYLGGMRFLTELMKEGTEQTLFRTNNGFSIISDNEILRRSLTSSVKEPYEVELCVAVLVLWQAVCHGNEENQRLLITSGTSEQLLDLLSCKESEIYTECITLLSSYLLSEYGKGLLLCNLNLTRLMQILLGFLNCTDTIASTAMGILASLVPENKFKKYCRNDFTVNVLPSFEILLKNLKLVNKQVFPQCISIIGSFATDKAISGQIAGREEYWESCLAAIDEAISSVPETDYRETLYALLGLMVNLSVEQCCTIQAKAPAITERCISLLGSADGGILTRATGLLSHMLPQSAEAVEKALKSEIVKKMLRFIKVGGMTTTRYAVKNLAVCSSHSEHACEEIVKCDKKLSGLRKLLSSDDELVVGNAALCLSHCFEIPGAATSLLNSDIVRVLLKHAGGDAKQNGLQQNAAIALGKLCLAESRHRTELRELHGLEILTSCMKYIK
ncbi:tetratricopeptide repeat protein 12 isoform X1 [Chiloscyllium plagiosum]|uniref:tetratricopeptide repeat protein 12 isoform X1 n=2 Tax=Chiloscyllium plagiosum TaxID=36176 RepID=UPI001CB87BBA|nr:tetratricopeptide repeat protein 12 isoform X1 [Chiloscyllium plagiosum]